MKKGEKMSGEEKMEVLDLKPIKKKRVWVFLIKKDDNSLSGDQKMVLNNLMETYDMKFATISLEKDELNNFKHTELGLFLGNVMLPCYNVNIPEYAKGHLDLEISEQEKEVSELENEYNAIADINPLKAEQIKSWIHYLREELKEKEEFLNTDLKSQWIVQKIFDIIRYYEDSLYYEETLYILHFTPERLALSLKDIFEELGVSVIIGNIEVNLLSSTPLIAAGGIN